MVRDDELLEVPSDEQQLAKLPAAERAEAEARRAVIALRRLLCSHRKEQVGQGGARALLQAAVHRCLLGGQRRLLCMNFMDASRVVVGPASQDELAAEKRERLRALDVQQRQHFADEKLKLGRLAVIQYQQIGPVRVAREGTACLSSEGMYIVHAHHRAEPSSCFLCCSPSS